MGPCAVSRFIKLTTLRRARIVRQLGAVLLIFATLAASRSADGSTVGSLNTSKKALTIALDARPRTVDPRFVGTDANSQYLEPLLFLPLFGFGETGAPQPILAEGFAFEDSKNLIVKIRDGIRFAMGRSVDADDVVETYKFILNSDASKRPVSPRRGSFERVASVTRVSAREVKFTLSEPDVSLISNLVIGILPKEALSLPPDGVVDGKGFESGPFIVDRFDDSQWILKRNEQYSGAPFGGQRPALDSVIFKIFTDTNTRYAALLKGDIDLVQNGLDTDKVAEFINNRGNEFNVQLKTSDSTAFLAFNLKNKLFSDVRVRKAIGLAINRDEILRFTLQGMGKISNSMFPPGHAFHFENAQSLNFNPKEAEKLLDEAGYPDPDGPQGRKERAAFTLKVPLNRERIAVAKAIAGQLKKVGLKVKVEVLEFNTFMKHLNDGNIQAWIAAWTGYKDGDHLHFVFHSSRVPPQGANRGFYTHPAVDRWLDLAKGDHNFTARNSLYQKVQGVLAKDLPYIFLWHRMGHVVMQKNVSGFKLFPDGRYSSLTEIVKK